MNLILNRAEGRTDKKDNCERFEEHVGDSHLDIWQEVEPASVETLSQGQEKE